MPTTTAPKRGAIPSPRSDLAAARPHVALKAPPPNAIVMPPQLSFWGNDVHGDCVTAEEAFAKACNSPEIFITYNDVITWATDHGVLEGAYLTQVLNFMQTDGFSENGSVYDDGPYFSVDWTNSTTLQSAIAMGPVKIGIAADQLDAAWLSTGGQTGWFATGFHPDSNEDHCVSLCGYGTISWLAEQLNAQVPSGVDGSSPGYALFTWDSIGIIDVPSMIAITHEAWLRNPTTVTGGLLRTYIVVAGDTLSGIAQSFYGDPSLATMLAAVNGISDPDVIEVGVVLVIPNTSHTYTVVAGDTLSGIAQRIYGDPSQVAMLAAVNGISDPDVIEVGVVLVIPDISHTYTVVAGDTLSGIAQRSYGYASLYTLIAEVNNIADPDPINPGQVLILPSM